MISPSCNCFSFNTDQVGDGDDMLIPGNPGLNDIIEGLRGHLKPDKLEYVID